MEVKKTRLACFDRMRTVAIIGVIYTSVCGWLVERGAADAQPLTFSWHLANLLNCAFSFAVPLLFMSLGAILLEKDTSLSVRYVAKHRILRLLIPLAVWSVIYLVFRFLWQGFSGENAVPQELVRALLHTPAANHLWLIYALVALYLVLPFLRLLVQHASPNLLTYGVCLWLGLHSVWRVLSGLFPNLSLPSYTAVDVVGGYAGYALFGWVLANRNWKIPRLWLGIGYGVVLLFTVVGVALMSRAAGESNTVLCQSYMPNVVLMSSLVFLVCRDFDRVTVFTPWVTPMAQFAIGIYFIHELFRLLLLPVCRWLPAIVTLIAMPPLIWLLSLITVAFMRRLRVTRRLFMGE